MTTSTIAATCNRSARGRAASSPKFGRAGLSTGLAAGPSTFSLRHGLARSDFEQARPEPARSTPAATTHLTSVVAAGLLDLI